MTLFIISFIAGVLTVLAPCILPLLPIIIGSSVDARSKATPYIVIGSLATSILLFTYLLKASTALITIPPYVWSYLSGGILLGFSLILMFPKLWESLPFLAKTSSEANQLMGEGMQKKSVWGDVLIGAALGPVFSTCSPTYLVILATVLPASFFLGTLYLLTYLAGLILVLVLIALLGQRFTTKLQAASNSRGWFKKVIGLLFLLIGLAIVTGFDKKIETAILDNGYINITGFEQGLLDSLNVDAVELNSEKEMSETIQTSPKNKDSNLNSVKVPTHLQRLFPDTDWARVNPDLVNALSGGPTKDGIPAIDNPKFIPLQDFPRGDDVQAIVLQDNVGVKVYPYNILTLHEIVNDVVDDVPVAITFCPLCGSAIVYDRTLPDGQISTIGISGSLLESNMIMYDRSTENLWQQSTGKTLAGSFHPAQLDIVKFQLMTISDVKKSYPKAQVLSEDTGHRRNYSINPYSDYETDGRFTFETNDLDTTFPLKSIMVVFRTTNGIVVTAPWLKLREAGSGIITIDSNTYTLTTNDTGELNITDTNHKNYPFYFEMWFSLSIQHGDNLKILKL